MIDGTYVGSVNTPMGNIQGKVSLVSNGNKAEGTLEIMGMKSQFTDGNISGNTCTFQGNMKLMMGTIEYHVSGTVNGDTLDIIAKTNKGEFTLQGKRVSKM